jgi:hypothetical protein
VDGEIEASTQFVHHLDRFEALAGLFVECRLVVRQQIGISLVVRAADAAA